MGSGGVAPPIMYRDAGEGQWSHSQPGHFTSGKDATPAPHWLWDLAVAGAGLDAVEKSCVFLPLPEIELQFLGCSGCSLVSENSRAPPKFQVPVNK
jgi:hypothetical protein